MESDLMQRTAAQNPPPGFHPIALVDGFLGRNGPVFVKREDDGSVVFGGRVMPHMTNPMGAAHGGWLATLVDVTLPLTARFTVPELDDHFLLTVNLSIDYLAGAKLGDWIEGRARVLRRTTRMAFVDGLLSVEGETIARASGIFRTGPGGPSIPFGSGLPAA